MLKDLTVHWHEIVVDCPDGSIKSTARVVHCDNCNGTPMRGMFKTFQVVKRVACGGGFVTSAINSTNYIDSSPDLLHSTSSDISTPAKVYDKCLQISNATRHLLSHMGANQRRTGKAYVVMTPGLFLNPSQRNVQIHPTLLIGIGILIFHITAIHCQLSGTC
jgi:hypothetical protein